MKCLTHSPCFSRYREFCMKHFNLERYAFEHQQQCFVAHRLSQISHARLKLRIATPSTMRAVAVAPTPATHAILTQLKAGECIRHSI